MHLGSGRTTPGPRRCQLGCCLFWWRVGSHRDVSSGHGHPAAPGLPWQKQVLVEPPRVTARPQVQVLEGAAAEQGAADPLSGTL